MDLETVVTCPKQGHEMEAVALHGVGFLAYSCPKHGQDFKPSAAPLYPNLGQVPLPGQEKCDTFRGPCVFCAPLDRYIGRHIDRCSTDMSVDMSTDISVDISIEMCRSTYRLTYQPRYRPTIGRYLGRYSGRHSADTLTIDYRRNIGRLSVVYRSTVL